MEVDAILEVVGAFDSVEAPVAVVLVRVGPDLDYPDQADLPLCHRKDCLGRDRLTGADSVRVHHVEVGH